MNNVLVYRNNPCWEELEKELAELSVCYEIDKQKFNDATVTVKVFPAGMPETDIRNWLIENGEIVSKAKKVYCDGTTSAIIISLELRDYFGCIPFDKYLKEAADKVFENRSPGEVYRQIFSRITAAIGITRVQIVLEALMDYNPLVLEEFVDYRRLRSDQLALTRYANEFAKLLPESVKVEYVRVNDLMLPEQDCLVITHHHALQYQGNKYSWKEFDSNSRVLMSYPGGLIRKASELCDISMVVKGDVLEKARQSILSEVQAHCG